ncbi:restriction endonuclease subunit S [Pseudoalteromonas issachenkonii]|uniref:Restriction endonuclease subunit S n=1 Tax=Pseudoalteromonas issachenkonii TaxID=152297 RepID=A0ABU9H1A5_9GAMM
MRSHYKRIGDFVTQIKLKNTDGSISLLKGIKINKHFMPSVANINGTDLSKYRVVKKNQFAFNPMHVGRDEVLPISMLEDDESIIVSPAYVVFEVKDEEELLPEYLMMWCRRSEFDRNAWFMTDNSVRGGFSWADFCDMELPIPSIEKQREIVREYNVVNDRISLNEQLTQKLEESAQAIYKQWFVDFEFPISKEYAQSIGKPELEGKPYKSSGGEMEYCEIIEYEIPQYWKITSLSAICSIGSSKRVFQSEYVTQGIPFYRGKEVTLRQNGNLIDDPLFISESRFDELDSKFGSPKRGDILITAVGTIGSTYLVKGEQFYFKDGNIIWLKEFLSEKSNVYIFDFMQSQMFLDYINDITIGSTQSAITIKSLGLCPVLLPDDQTLLKYCEFSGRLKSYYESVVEEKSSLSNLKNIILSKISKSTV